jgi:TolB-like protein
LPDSVPPELRSLIGDCLAKDPSARFESARDIACTLRALAAGSGARTESKVEKTPRLGPRGALAVVAAAVLVMALAFGVWQWRSHNPPIHPKTIAVLYFSNLSEDRSLDWLNRGLTEMLTTNFSEVRDIDVLSTERVASVLNQLGKKQVTADIAPVLARRAGAHAFVSGALMRIGPSRLRLDVRVQDTSNGQILFSEKIEGEDGNAVFKMVDGLTSRMAPRFLPSGRASGSGPSIEENATSNLEAYRHYQAGRDHQRRYFRRDAIREFQESVRLDPQFALAWMHMGRIYESVGETRKACETRERVQPLTARLSRKDRLTWEAMSAGAVWDWDAQRRAWEALLAEYPRESGERAQLSARYRKDNEVQRAIALLKEGLALDPNDDFLWNELSYRHADAGDVASAIESNDRY